MKKSFVFSIFQFLLLSVTSCNGQGNKNLPAENPYIEQYNNMLGKWATIGPDKEGLDTLELFENGNYLSQTVLTRESGKWNVVDVHHISLGEVKYRFFFKGKSLVLIDKNGKQYELANQNLDDSDIQSILNNSTLISPFVRRIFQDKNGDLWFGTNGDGAARYDGETLEYFSEYEGFGGLAVRGIVGDVAGNVWFGTSGGLTKYDGISFTNFTEKDGLLNNDVWSLTIDSKGIIWIGTLQGVSCFNGKTFTPFNLPETKPDPNRGVTSARIVHSIMEDSKGKIWFGTNGGAYIYDTSQEDGHRLSNISTTDGLPDNSVNDILEDKNGNIWFATHYEGVCFWDGKSFTRMATKERESGTEAWSLYEDSSGNIWFPIENFGVYRYDGESLSNFNEKDGLSSKAIQCVFEDREGKIWLGGWKGLFRYDQSSESAAFFSVTKYGPWD